MSDYNELHNIKAAKDSWNRNIPSDSTTSEKRSSRATPGFL